MERSEIRGPGTRLGYPAFRFAPCGLRSRRHLLPPLDVLLDPFQQQAGDLVAVGVPHHDVVVAPDAGLRDLIVERAARQPGQRVVDRVAADLVDLAISLEAWAGVGPADLVDAVDAERRHL